MKSMTVLAAALAPMLLASMAQAATPAQSQAQVAARTIESTPPVPYDAGVYRLLVPAESQDGRFAVIELVEGPGYQTPWHRHDAMEERYYVAEGTLTLSSAEGTRDYPAGSYVTIPPGAAHAQGNRTAQPVRLLLTITPGGFEQFFIDRAELHKTVQRGDPAFQDEMVKLAMRHGRWLQPAEAPSGAATP
ncbi:hypothetical protein GCM10027400_16650 [Pseudoxanthomonas daejeonensis]